MDLLDWHRGAVSSRRLAVLVKHLPRDSAVNRDLHGEAVEWDSTAHLLAATVDHLAVANWMTATLNAGEDADPLDYPEPVPRPGHPQATVAGGESAHEEGAGPPADSPTPAQLFEFFR
ncbi:hypothetical protein ACIBCO_39195 [Streptomyces violascens]|uniref:hypothetical protein n=1 Tax=Streptomyces violascens TaxID=67381 RepID=UPI0037B93611